MPGVSLVEEDESGNSNEDEGKRRGEALAGVGVIGSDRRINTGRCGRPSGSGRVSGLSGGGLLGGSGALLGGGRSLRCRGNGGQSGQRRGSSGGHSRRLRDGLARESSGSAQIAELGAVVGLAAFVGDANRIRARGDVAGSPGELAVGHAGNNSVDGLEVRRVARHQSEGDRAFSAAPLEGERNTLLDGVARVEEDGLAENGSGKGEKSRDGGLHCECGLRYSDDWNAMRLEKKLCAATGNGMLECG